MKTKAISSIFVLFAIAAGMASMAPDAYAHPHDEISIIAFDESTISSYIADMEHENPMFKEAVKLATAPLLSSLTLMENAESESEVLRTWTLSHCTKPWNVHRTSSIWNCQSNSIKKKLIFILECN